MNRGLLLARTGQEATCGSARVGQLVLSENRVQTLAFMHC